jgi:hypothetical protein
MYPQNFKMIGVSIQVSPAIIEKSKMAAGGHLGYHRTSKNNRLLPLGPLKVHAKYLVDWSITLICRAVPNPFYGRGRGQTAKP